MPKETYQKRRIKKSINNLQRYIYINIFVKSSGSRISIKQKKFMKESLKKFIGRNLIKEIETKKTQVHVQRKTQMKKWLPTHLKKESRQSNWYKEVCPYKEIIVGSMTTSKRNLNRNLKKEGHTRAVFKKIRGRDLDQDIFQKTISIFLEKSFSRNLFYLEYDIGIRAFGPLT